MNGFERGNSLLSLCGLNCGLCPMRLGGHCGGCGNGNQSCKIARCSLEHGGVEYCCECVGYPCEKYERIDEYDSFITHRCQKADLEKVIAVGVERYNREQEEKIRLLSFLLDNFNDGRRRSFFCTAVNLLELPEIHEALDEIRASAGLALLPLRERSSYVSEVLQRIAGRRNVDLKLRKKA